MVSEDFRRQLAGYGLTTVQVWCRRHDAPWLINSNWISWQLYDVCPKFPRLLKCLNDWLTDPEITSKPAIVKVAHSNLIRATEIKMAEGMFRLN